MLDAPLYRALAVLLEVEVLQVAGLRLTGRRDKAANQFVVQPAAASLLCSVCQTNQREREVATVTFHWASQRKLIKTKTSNKRIDK